MQIVITATKVQIGPGKTEAHQVSVRNWIDNSRAAPWRLPRADPSLPDDAGMTKVMDTGVRPPGR
ncbi:hypothetical protein CCHOA_04975 [Corynebacterium choanae]|uniref:Uncharacterized protein n=1 Tax=Corynebacterium choanae TaxID=1862358 RepID=A0A3G6J5M9_9CORY|nr:hypothetical protein CCHOA_04975 [Corynebacterium choanae]